MFNNFRRHFSRTGTLSVADHGHLIELMSDLYKNQILQLRRHSSTHIIISSEMFQESSNVSKISLEDYGKWALESISLHSNSSAILQVGVQTLRELRAREMFAHNVKKKTLDWAESYKGDSWSEICLFAALSCAENDKDTLEKLCASYIRRMNIELADPDLVNIPDQVTHWDSLRFLAQNRWTGAKMCLELTEPDGLKLLAKSMAQYSLTPEEFPLLKIIDVIKATCSWRPYYITRLLKSNQFFKQFRAILPSMLQLEHPDEVRLTLLIEAYLDLVIYLCQSKMSCKLFSGIDFLTSLSSALLIHNKMKRVSPFRLYMFVTMIVLVMSYEDPLFLKQGLGLVCSAVREGKQNFGKGYYTVYFFSWLSQYTEFLRSFLETNQNSRSLSRLDVEPEVESAVKITQKILGSAATY